MPELPEVETTLRGIQPHIEQHLVKKIIVRHPRLRWPISPEIAQLKNKKILSIERRAKYLLFKFTAGTIIVHLGMSGSLRLLTQPSPAQKHDHVDFIFADFILRYTDPRRFGAILWTEENPFIHTLLKELGPEPLSSAFSSRYLISQAQRRTLPIKSLIMDGKIVVGVGNIYATEALFLAGIHPEAASKSVSDAKLIKLVKAIKVILKNAIQQGGTTLKDFVNSDGKPGYFKQKLKVYGRGNKPCLNCKTNLINLRIGQRSTVYCSRCQS